MKQTGPIILIEDDEDDQMVLRDIFKELQLVNELIVCASGIQALEYLRDPSVEPFLVLSDLNMPVMNGLQVLDIIRQDDALSAKCFPYIFMSTAASKPTVTQAFSLGGQGFFTKPASVKVFEETIHCIVQYWQKSNRPH
ncbi:MAG: response regulator [Flavitalea sp.]